MINITYIFRYRPMRGDPDDTFRTDYYIRFMLRGELKPVWRAYTGLVEVSPRLSVVNALLKCLQARIL